MQAPKDATPDGGVITVQCLTYLNLRSNHSPDHGGLGCWEPQIVSVKRWNFIKFQGLALYSTSPHRSTPILFLPLLSSGVVIREVASSTCEWFEVVLSVTAKHIPP